MRRPAFLHHPGGWALLRAAFWTLWSFTTAGSLLVFALPAWGYPTFGLGYVAPGRDSVAFFLCEIVTYFAGLHFLPLAVLVGWRSRALRWFALAAFGLWFLQGFSPQHLRN